MRWTVLQLQNLRDVELEIDKKVDVSKDLKHRDAEIRDASPIHVTGTAHVDSQKVVFQLHLTGHLILPCSRTLVDVTYPIDIHSTETFILKPLGFEYSPGEEEDIHGPDEGVVDLIPVIEELILLEIPMQVFCEDAKNKEKLQSGQDWEVMTEDQFKLEQQRPKVDPRLAGLAALLKDKKE
ncbi:YceD family protein [Lederbergia panacisoli]|uniref:YceD family protein n=1 Tax=Lederbergia panacisoli TaxID=1255251 RepID=UPI00214C52A6|nr:YceD family protein [Lederbergia panacisoli]MCR2820828.1 YceD family protein [Lederbergia panacisoli]